MIIVVCRILDLQTKNSLSHEGTLIDVTPAALVLPLFEHTMCRTQTIACGASIHMYHIPENCIT